MTQTNEKKEIKEDVEKIPTVMVKTTYYSDKRTGEFLGKKDEWQDNKGKWHLL